MWSNIVGSTSNKDPILCLHYELWMFTDVVLVTWFLWSFLVMTSYHNCQWKYACESCIAFYRNYWDQTTIEDNLPTGKWTKALYLCCNLLLQCNGTKVPAGCKCFIDATSSFHRCSWYGSLNSTFLASDAAVQCNNVGRGVRGPMVTSQWQVLPWQCWDSVCRGNVSGKVRPADQSSVVTLPGQDERDVWLSVLQLRSWHVSTVWWPYPR